ncbi:replication initiation protein [Romboutsia maritimum]|uniref:Replication initiation protein n=2 Tax=Romboutsia maritimum TaxID=2020948 RepID=A0A371IPS4_9FIRM|nr:replication initiation protein [Romboutsia maritimum]
MEKFLMEVIKIEEDKVLMKNNLLVKARYSISLIENRIFLLMLYKLQKENDGILKCQISLSEFKKIIKFKGKNSANGILEVLEELRKKPIFFKEKKKNNKGHLWGAYGFINGYYYDDELGTFHIEASEKIHEILKEYLKMGYTPINVQIWLSLNNSYAQRFYDLLRLWSGTKNVITYKINELKELLMLDEKYDKYNDFKRRVIKPAINELNKTEYFNIEIRENKVGRKIESIDFIVTDFDKRKYFDTKIIEEKPIVIDKINSNSDFYVPNKKLFTAKTLSNFINDFKKYDFANTKIKSIFYESIGTTLDKDDEDKIKVKSYNYFKTTLLDKLNKSDKKQSIPQVKTRFHNINQTFTKYTSEELEKKLLESQKDKFK